MICQGTLDVALQGLLEHARNHQGQAKVHLAIVKEHTAHVLESECPGHPDDLRVIEENASLARIEGLRADTIFWAINNIRSGVDLAQRQIVHEPDCVVADCDCKGPPPGETYNIEHGIPGRVQ